MSPHARAPERDSGPWCRTGASDERPSRTALPSVPGRLTRPRTRQSAAALERTRRRRCPLRAAAPRPSLRATAWPRRRTRPRRPSETSAAAVRALRPRRAQHDAHPSCPKVSCPPRHPGQQPPRRVEGVTAGPAVRLPEGGTDALTRACLRCWTWWGREAAPMSRTDLGRAPQPGGAWQRRGRRGGQRPPPQSAARRSTGPSSAARQRLGTVGHGPGRAGRSQPGLA